MSGNIVVGAAELARDLAAAAKGMRSETPRVVQVAALKIKQGMQRDAAGSAHFKQIARSISYDLADGGMTAEIGPRNDGGAGELANIAYVGTSRGGGTLNLTGPLDAETPTVVEHLTRLMEGR